MLERMWRRRNPSGRGVVFCAKGDKGGRGREKYFINFYQLTFPLNNPIIFPYSVKGDRIHDSYCEQHDGYAHVQHVHDDARAFFSAHRQHTRLIALYFKPGSRVGSPVFVFGLPHSILLGALRIFFAAALPEKLEIHKVCLHFSAFSATKNLSQIPLAASRSASLIYGKYRKETV